MSTTSFGNRYKKKTKDLFIEQGYVCEYLEKLQTIFTGKGVFYKKSDLFAADGIAMNGKEIIFWNSKATKDLQRYLDKMSYTDIKEFQKYPFPQCDQIKVQIIVWVPRVKKPYIIDVKAKE